MRLFSQYKGLRNEVYILFVCKLIDSMGSVIGPMLTLILSTKMGMNATEIALYATLFMILSLPMSYLGGKACDKYNKKLVINICDITTSLLYICCGIIGLNITTIIIYFIGSMLQMIESPAYDTLAADYTIGEQRDKAYSLLYLGMNFGMMLAPTIGGFLINNHIQLMFILNGLFQLLSIIVFDIFVKDTTAVIDDDNTYEAKSDSISTIQILKENRIITEFLIIFGISMFVYNMWGYLMPLSLSSIQGELGSIYYGTMSTLNCIEVVLFTTIITASIAKLTSINRMILGNVLEVLGFVVFLLFINTPFMYYVAIFIFTLGEITNTISTTPHLSKRIPINYRGRINAASNIIYNIFAIIGEIITGYVYDRFGLYQAWIFIIFIGLLTILAYQLSKKKDKESFPNLYNEK